MKLNIVGLGRLGKVFARLWVLQGLGEIQDIHSTTTSSVLAFINEVGQGRCCQNLLEMSRADLTVITVPDDVISVVANTLAQNRAFEAGDMVIHCSGRLSSIVLASFHERGCLIASVHPMRSFTEVWKEKEAYVGTYCALEGDLIALQRLQTIIGQMGFLPFLIASDKKSTYHCSGVWGANYLITLFYQALNALSEAGVDAATSKAIVLSLMRTTLDNLATESPEKALTGPLMRGDTQTLMAHLNILSGDSKRLYQSMAESTLKITSHSDKKRDEILQVIFKPSSDETN